MYQITVDTQNITARELELAVARFSELSDTVTEGNILEEAYLGVLLDLAGKAYFAQVDVADRMLAEQLDVAASRSLSVGMTGYLPRLQQNAAGVCSPTEEGNLYIDIDLDAHVVAGESAEAREYMLLSGMISSAYENIIWEQFTGMPSISTISVLGEAAYDDIPLQVLTKDNFDTQKSLLTLGGEDMAAIEREIRDGKVVLLPQSEETMGDWQGCGYMVLDPESYAARYMNGREKIPME